MDLIPKIWISGLARAGSSTPELDAASMELERKTEIEHGVIVHQAGTVYHSTTNVSHVKYTELYSGRGDKVHG